MKHIILCADDYGQNTAISQAIIELAQQNRLSATSCMANSYYWLSHAKWLQPLADKIDIGLHFTLTEGKLLSKGFDHIPLKELIIKAYLKQIKRSAIETELHLQLDQFQAGMGREPDFIDGHQHVHQLPVIRDALFNVYEKRLRKTGCYVRSTMDSQTLMDFKNPAYLKILAIQLCGAYAFKKALAKHQIPHSASFGGIYNFSNAQNYPTLFPEFLNKIGENGIVMCHPGLEASREDDEIADARYQEYRYFQSDQFLLDCSQKVLIARFNKNCI